MRQNYHKTKLDTNLTQKNSLQPSANRPRNKNVRSWFHLETDTCPTNDWKIYRPSTGVQKVSLNLTKQGIATSWHKAAANQIVLRITIHKSRGELYHVTSTFHGILYERHLKNGKFSFVLQGFHVTNLCRTRTKENYHPECLTAIFATFLLHFIFAMITTHIAATPMHLGTHQ